MHAHPTIRFARRKLPHWEVENGRYFITVRCADSLPRETLLRIQDLHRNVSQVSAQSAEYAALQRQIFRTLEKHLDAGSGACPLKTPTVAQIVIDELNALSEWQIAAPHFSIMPNHWHALLVAQEGAIQSLSAVMKRLKGRTAKRIRQAIGGTGAFWQSEWFDRWVRNDAEWSRLVAYIQNNPVKAGLACELNEHPWTH